jgi:hypothetical protein
MIPVRRWSEVHPTAADEAPRYFTCRKKNGRARIRVSGFVPARHVRFAGSAVVTLASCRIRIVRGHREPRRDCGRMALGAGWPRAMTRALWSSAGQPYF